MYEERFSEWTPWQGRNALSGLKYPGVYVIAHAIEPMAPKAFEWRKEVIYIGMTNSESGLRGRLKQFDNTLVGKSGHGGADRVRYKFRDPIALMPCLYVAVAPFECDVTSGNVSDLRTMGDVAQFEYLCFAHFVERFGRLPDFNNKKESRKYSLTVARGVEL
jgi:hypothetical protein